MAVTCASIKLIRFYYTVASMLWLVYKHNMLSLKKPQTALGELPAPLSIANQRGRGCGQSESICYTLPPKNVPTWRFPTVWYRVHSPEGELDPD